MYNILFAILIIFLLFYALFLCHIQKKHEWDIFFSGMAVIMTLIKMII